MIFDLADPEQHHALRLEMARQQVLYGNLYILPLGSGLVMILEPWLNPAAVR